MQLEYKEQLDERRLIYPDTRISKFQMMKIYNQTSAPYFLFRCVIRNKLREWKNNRKKAKTLQTLKDIKRKLATKE